MLDGVARSPAPESVIGLLYVFFEAACIVISVLYSSR